jgi:lipid A 3-O-deacylase
MMSPPPFLRHAASMAVRTMRALAAATLLVSPAALAQVPSPDAATTPATTRRIGTFSFKLENDLFGGSDRYYTAGWQLSWRSPGYEPPGAIRWLTDLGLLLLPRGTPRWGLAFGQQIFTPEDTELRSPDPRDRPYAGWLYGALTVSSYTATSYGAVELQLGVVGPSALGEQVQNNVHDFLGIDRALGWDYQLKDEPGVNLVWTRLWRYSWNLDRAAADGLQYGIVPGLTVSLGNVETYASAGLLARFGQNLAADFGPPRIRPALAGSGYFYPADQWGWYVFGGFEGRAIAQDIFLDGNTWRDSRSVNKKNTVVDFTLGAALIIPWGRLTYTHVFRTTEFDGQGDTFQFGSLSFSARF